MSSRKNKHVSHEKECPTLTTSKSNLSIRIWARITSSTNHTTPTATLSWNWITLVAIWPSSIALTVKATVCIRRLKVVLLQEIQNAFCANYNSIRSRYHWRAMQLLCYLKELLSRKLHIFWRSNILSYHIKYHITPYTTPYITSIISYTTYHIKSHLLPTLVGLPSHNSLQLSLNV